jgi:tRNA G18 (ribose-2'-O)-methylase SpoU
LETLVMRVRAQCDSVIAIAGTGRVESLNVAVAAGVLMAMMAKGR